VLVLGIVLIVAAALLGVFVMKKRKNGIVWKSSSGKDLTSVLGAIVVVLVFFGLWAGLASDPFGRTGGVANASVQKPTAAFVVEPLNEEGKVTDTRVSFDASASTAVEGHTIVEYQWDFGDGQTAEGTYHGALHPYAKAGSYTVTLKVVQSDPQNDGQVGVVSKTIDIVVPGLVAVTSESATPTTSAAAAPADPCPGSYQVKLFSNEGGNLFPEGYLSPDPETMRQQVLDGAKADPRVLQTYYNSSPLGQANPIANTTDIAVIQDGACFTAVGKKAYDEWVVLWKVTKLAPEALPAEGTNTGAVPNGPAYQETGLIPAGTGMKVEYVDANGNTVIVHKIRLECGNVVTTYTIILAPKPEGAPSIVTPPPPPAPPAAPPTTYVPPPTTKSTPPPSGKYYSDAPIPDAPILPAPPGGFVDRGGQPSSEPYVPPPVVPIVPDSPGQSDSGPGAVNTVAPPVTNSPAPAPPITDSPTTNVEAP
jgi:hypothetical protein